MTKTYNKDRFINGAGNYIKMKFSIKKGVKMIYTIKNESLTVEINSKGSELWSIKKGNTEYLWQGDATYWGNRATTLFPYIARSNQGKYTVYGKEYELPIHGFAKVSEFFVKSHTDNELVLEIVQNDETLAMYPFNFSFCMTFTLENDKIIQKYTVENRDEKVMFFGVGGHTGFNVPLDEGIDFTDYELEFNEKFTPTQIVFDEDKLVTDKTKVLDFNKSMKLQHNLFDDDAILLKNMPKTVELLSKKGEKTVKVSYPSMDYLAIWHKPNTDAPYVCIEPWSSTPARGDRIEDLEKQENLVSLEPKKIYENIWTIEIK